MAYVAKGNYGYGDGLNGDVENPSGQINSYANVTAYTANSITIGAASNGIYEKFTAGNEIMIHVSATNGTSQEFSYLGKYIVAKIKTVSGSVLTIDSDFTQTLPAAEFSKYQAQAITIAKFKNMTLKTTTITPPAYNITSKYGGILLAKCSNAITFSGGNINLVDKGIPVANTAYRPLTLQEINGTADTDKYSGWENHITIREFLLNAGDGACMLWAKKFVQTGAASRIGGTTAGVQFGRGNKGGSTIAMVCGDMTGFDPSIISKTKNTGQGLGRCYIASKTKLRNDEGLYAYDCISDPFRVMRDLNIKGYGDGSLGDVINPTLPINNYARVVGISGDGKTIAYNNKTINGMAQISKGSTVMFHVSKHNDSADMSLLGKFILVKVLSDDGNSLVVDTPVTKVFDIDKLSKYSCQIVSMAQFDNLTINTDYDKTIAWNDSIKIGGICAIASKGICNIEDGKINVAEKGGGSAYGREGLAFIGNSQNNDILPLGQGAGSIFLLANDVKANKNTRIGSKFTGNRCGGNCTWNNGNHQDIAGVEGGYIGAGGQGGGGDKPYRTDASNRGGYGGENGLMATKGGSKGATGASGAHLFIVINRINKFDISFIATGGYIPNASNIPGAGNFESNCGGAGYGSGACGYAYSSGGFIGGGGGRYTYGASGGSGGCAFFYINAVEEFDETGVRAA